jgi:hypothetical protein
VYAPCRQHLTFARRDTNMGWRKRGTTYGEKKTVLCPLLAQRTGHDPVLFGRTAPGLCEHTLPIRGNFLTTKLRIPSERRGEVSIVSAHNCAHVLLGRLSIAFQAQWSIVGVLITPCLKSNSLASLKDAMAGEQPERVTAKEMDSKRATTAKGNSCSSNRAT